MPDSFRDPAKEFSLMPFWFWNDDLSDAEIIRQIDEFEKNGVHGFVIHPRVGLPREIGWMSARMLAFMRVAVEEAARRGMKVILYDEGMYPSGSSSGQVVERSPELAARCLASHDPNVPLPEGAIVVAEGTNDAGDKRLIVDRRVNAYIRGIHYIGEGPKEDEPPAGDILNIKTTELVIELVYERCYQALKDHFGKTILGMFTDEPSPLGKCRERGVMPYTTGIIPHLNKILGYDLTPKLPQLFSAKEDAKPLKDAYRMAVRERMNETWYRPLSEWCAKRGVALCGHPDAGDEIGVQRYFQFPGQDLVWRFVEPSKPSAIEGAESTQAKCSSSAMIHYGRRRNSNEFCGAYGHQTTFEEVQWLANWCLVRGLNLLIPHAFYYSIRGPRVDERPPQIGLHTPQWNTTFKAFADHCRRLCWINTDSQHVADIAILTNDDRCPWPAAKACLQNQRDFNYLDPHSLLNHAKISEGVLSIASMKYNILIIDDARPLSDELIKFITPMIESGHVLSFGDRTHHDRIIRCPTPRDLIDKIGSIASPDVTLAAPAPGLRIRHMQKNGEDFYLLFNEEASPIETELRFTHAGKLTRLNTATADESPVVNPLKIMLAGYEMTVVRVAGGHSAE